MTQLKPISGEITKGEKVKLFVETENTTENPIMKLAENIYEGLSREDIEEIEKIALDRSNFFGKNPHRILELLEGIDENNIHGEVDFGKSVGKEIW